MKSKESSQTIALKTSNSTSCLETHEAENNVTVRCVYDTDHIYLLRTQNTSESDPHSYEATKAAATKAQEKCKR